MDSSRSIEQLDSESVPSHPNMSATFEKTIETIDIVNEPADAFMELLEQNEMVQKSITALNDMLKPFVERKGRGVTVSINEKARRAHDRNQRYAIDRIIKIAMGVMNVKSRQMKTSEKGSIDITTEEVIAKVGKKRYNQIAAAVLKGAANE